MERTLSGLINYIREHKGEMQTIFELPIRVMNVHELSIDQSNWLMILWCSLKDFIVAWVFLEVFPDFENIDFIRFKDWANSQDRTLFIDHNSIQGRKNTVFKYEEFKTLSRIVNNYSIHRSNTYLQNNGEVNFNIIWDEMKGINIYFDRWKYLRILKYIFREDIEPKELVLYDKYNVGMYNKLSNLLHTNNISSINDKISKIISVFDINFLEFEYLFREYFFKYNRNINVNSRSVGNFTNFNYFNN